MKTPKDLKKMPVHQTDADAEDFVENADLSEYDFSDFKPMHFEFQKKDARLEVRMSHEQLKALKSAAKRQGIPHTRLVRQFIEQGMRTL